MQTRNKILDDLAQLMSNAMGVAQGAKVEAETAMKSLVDRWLADRNLVTREEFDAVRAMAQKAREENEALKARIAALEVGRPGRQRRLTKPLSAVAKSLCGTHNIPLYSSPRVDPPYLVGQRREPLICC